MEAGIAWPSRTPNDGIWAILDLPVETHRATSVTIAVSMTADGEGASALREMWVVDQTR